MTQKFEGNVSLDGTTIVMPTNTDLPQKQDWHSYSIWEFNGKAWRPVTQKANENLDDIVKKLQDMGYTYAKKDGKIKPSSLRYMIKTTGVEDFVLAK